MSQKRKSNYKRSSKVDTLKTILLQVSRYLFGAVFIFSGFVKAIDPLGSTYKFQDYFQAFGSFFTYLDSAAFPLAIALSTLELLIGLNLIFSIHIKRTAILGLLFMLVMTPLTLYLAIANPVSDCGCFGEALVITNWQTFWKNIVLLVLILVLLCTYKKSRPLFMPVAEWIMVFVFIAFGIGLSLYSYRHLPMIDFLPYKVGVNIPDAMYVPEDAPADVYNTTFIYEKNGVQKEFTLENYPKNDPSWKFVDQKTVLVTKGYKPKIHDFSIVNDQFEDITEDVIYNTGYSYLAVMYDVNKTSVEGAQKLEALYQKYKKSVTRFYALTASSDEDIAAFRQKSGVTFPFYKTDPTTLKTVIRANPGLLLIKSGNILEKWNWRDFK